MARSIITLAACAALFSGCGGGAAGAGPRGWTHSADGLWSNPRSARDQFTATSVPYDGTMKDLASLTATNIVLRNKAKLVKAAPFSRCPAVAATQTFSLPGGGVMLVAFSVQNGRRVQTEYVRAGKEANDPAAIDAMAANVCALP